MSATTCPHCGALYQWSWEDAFDKFGFGDGGGIIMTDSVSRALIEAGYTTELVDWGMHNTS